MLTDEQIDESQHHADAGDRIAYYQTLFAETEARYADLALGVVLHDQLSGRTANEFFLERMRAEIDAHNGDPVNADDQRAYLDNDQLAEISVRLMQEDLLARQNPDLFFGDRLRAQVVEDYHEAVFAEFGITVRAWTPFWAMAAAAEAAGRDGEDPDLAKEAIWERFLATDGWLATAAQGGLRIAGAVLDDEFVPFELLGTYGADGGNVYAGDLAATGSPEAPPHSRPTASLVHGPARGC